MLRATRSRRRRPRRAASSISARDLWRDPERTTRHNGRANGEAGTARSAAATLYAVVAPSISAATHVRDRVVASRGVDAVWARVVASSFHGARPRVSARRPSIAPSTRDLCVCRIAGIQRA